MHDSYDGREGLKMEGYRCMTVVMEGGLEMEGYRCCSIHITLPRV